MVETFKVYDKQGEFFDKIFDENEVYFCDIKEGILYNLWSTNQTLFWEN